MTPQQLPTVSTGIDILRVSRLEPVLSGENRVAFLRRTFTAAEIAEGVEREDEIRYFAGRFAAKEAVFKALSVAWAQEDDPRDIEVTTSPEGIPQVLLSGNLAVTADERGVCSISLSISLEDEYVCAVAVAVVLRCSTDTA